MNYRDLRFESWTWLAIAASLLLCVTLLPAGTVWADDEPAAAAEEPAAEETAAEEEAAPLTAEDVRFEATILWTCLAAFLVFFMQAGFAMVETGFTRAKSACNILMKNLMDFSVGTLAFWMVGFGLMFGATTTGWYGTSNFFFDAGDDQFNWAFLLFQTVFCATAATIVSGAMAERTKFEGYLLYSIGICVLVYPVFGKWAWGSLLPGTEGGGWLEGMEFYDFAGSTVVHSVGGWAALAGALVIGPRLGKYTADGKSIPIPGHSIPLGALGVFILWLGWFGFNAGSTTAVDGGSFAYLCVTTNVAAAGGAVVAMLASWALFKKPDTSFALNGALAGLVSITAGCPVMSVGGAIIAGGIGGLICVLAVVMFDRLRIDDPVGAISVHGVCGAWGTLAVGLFATVTPNNGADGVIGLFYGGGAGVLGTQLVGVAAAFAWTFPVSLVLFLAIKYTVGLRVSPEEEHSGLDVSEHGMQAYPSGLFGELSGGTPAPVGMSPVNEPEMAGV
ncbi:MAG: ammonium transporter [Planctomycetota bacterium]|nr:MAG: ammonium transporter [Planctomycetota bacterium]REJ94364.1 MAG: ammonium transporter [Planctomycetota bacterium]REK22104.1 MAG: ammonium transporter [Planctomycetota bacterium]REK44511.1 MAG: ammonium transporter [Planctomycetota bacterium]